ncbi:MAG: homoserine O-acetyltransferase MetX [Fusobacteriota bacterium]
MKKISGRKKREKKYPPNSAETLNLKTGSYTFATGEKSDPLLKLESGIEFGPITLAYESYGKLNDKKDNAILICHALTGNAHVAGKIDKDSETGWWDPIIGPGRPLDTDKYFIVCSNILGGCSGSTGPHSINPETDEPYAMDFPTITIKDMVNSQKRMLTEHFEINHLDTIIGGSIGGMQALQWGVTYPNFTDKLGIIAATPRLSSQAIAFNKIGRHAIMMDPKWNHGNYYNSTNTIEGFALARMVAHITYLSDEGMQIKFGREHSDISEYFEFDKTFEVENYLDHQGYKFIKRFDANSYLFLSKAMDLFNISRDFDSLKDAIANIQSKKTLVISFTSDWLFPPYQSKKITKLLDELNKPFEYHEISSHHGHDSFLIEYDKINPIISNFVNEKR